MKKNIFVNHEKQLRLLWVWLIGLAAYYLWNWHLTALISGGIEALYALSVSVLIQGIPTVRIEMISAVGTIVIFLVLSKKLLGKREEERFNWGRMFKWAGIGFIAAVAGILLCLILDSLRLETSFAQPAFGITQLIALPLCFLVKLAGEIFVMDYLFESAQERLNKYIAFFMVLAVELLLEGMEEELTVFMLINSSLQVLLCCLMHNRVGLPATVGLLFGWSYVLTAIFSTSNGVIWQYYTVSENWLTGGEAGLFGGAWATLVLVLLIASMLLRDRRAAKAAP